jgi:hypothetical protein
VTFKSSPWEEIIVLGSVDPLTLNKLFRIKYSNVQCKLGIVLQEND